MKSKIHVILRKEDIKPELLSNKVALVLDILCATSSITTALAHHIDRVIPALNGEHALQIAQASTQQDYLLAGEFNAETLPSFSSTTPLRITQMHRNHLRQSPDLLLANFSR